MGLRSVWITERDNQTSKRFCVAVEPVRSQQAQESGCCLGSGLSPSTHWGLSSLSQRMETGYLPLMVCQAKGQLLREAGCGGRAFPPQLLLQDLVAQQIVVFGDLHLMSSVLSRHCGQMALVE